MMVQKQYSQDEQKKALQQALFHFTTKSPFLGAMLTELNIKYSTIVPTAAITYNKKQDCFEVYLNPSFFCRLNLNQRIAILCHEIYHFTNQHLFRLPFLTKDEEERRLYNIAADMAINQYIPDIPNGCPQCPPLNTKSIVPCPNQDCPGKCIDVSDWKDKKGMPFPTYQTMEQYYLLIKDSAKKKQQGNEQGNENEQGQEGEGQPSDGQGKPQPGEGKYENVGKSNAGDNLNKYSPLDEHMWDELSEEEKEQMLQEAKKMIKRTVDKTSFGHSIVPDTIKDLLEELEVSLGKMNYKAILKACIKKSVSCVDRANTWNRRNKRYGVYAPGSTYGKLPKLNIYIDSSGSISLTEMNQFKGIMDKFLHTGVRECILNFWHTNLYYTKKYKLNNVIEQDDLQSGGTDVSCVLQDIKEENPELSIILTDGYYDQSSITVKSEVIWIISHNGNKSHPMAHVGKTIPLDLLGDE